MTPTQRERLVQGWFKSKNHTLWGRSFDLIQNPDPAVDWFLEQVNDFLDYAEHYAPPTPVSPYTVDL